MKNPDLKITKIKVPKLGKSAPYVFIFIFIVAGLLILALGYFAFQRPPEKSLVDKENNSLQEIQIDLDKNKVLKLFDSEYSVSNIKEPTFPTKNPFLNF